MKEYTRVRAYMAASYGRGAVINQSYRGEYTDNSGLAWRVWSAIGNRLSSIVRLEPTGKNPRARCRYIYDPGGHWRRANNLHTERKLA